MEHISDTVQIISLINSSFAEQEDLFNPTLKTTHQVTFWWELIPATPFLRSPASSTVFFDVWLKIFCGKAESWVKFLFKKAFSHDILIPYNTVAWSTGLQGEALHTLIVECCYFTKRVPYQKSQKVTRILDLSLHHLWTNQNKLPAFSMGD